MHGVVLEVALRHARALREQQLERLIELVVRELLAHRWAKERRTPARRAADVGGELEARVSARHAQRALPLRYEDSESDGTMAEAASVEPARTASPVKRCRLFVLGN